MCQHLTDTLQALADIATSTAPDYPECLQAGLNHTQIQAILDEAGFGYQPPDEWYALYEWRDGSTRDEAWMRTPLFYYHEFMPLGEALALYAELVDDESLPLYAPNMLPIFYFEGEFYAIECHSESRAHGRIHFIYHDDTLCYDSLTAMLDAKLECYRTGVYGLDDDGDVSCVDGAACAAILLKHNPVRALPFADAPDHSLADAYHP